MIDLPDQPYFPSKSPAYERNIPSNMSQNSWISTPLVRHNSVLDTTPTLGMYALTSIASRIPMIATVHKSIRAIAKSRSPSFFYALSEETSFESDPTALKSKGPLPPQDLVITTDNFDSRAKILLPSIPSTSACKGGVDWETAKTGVIIWTDAVRRIEMIDAKQAMQMHVDAIKYMHIALPAELADSDLHVLLDSLTASRDPPHKPAYMNLQDVPVAQDTQIGKNFIRTTTASLVCRIISFVLFAIPVFTYLLSRALRYEREHQITKRTIQNSANVAKVATAVSVDVSERLFNFKDTKFGACCTAASSSIFQGVLEGINDGVQTSRSRDLSFVLAPRIEPLPKGDPSSRR